MPCEDPAPDFDALEEGTGFCRVTEVPSLIIGALKLIFGKFAGGTNPGIPGRVGMLAWVVPGGAPLTPGGGGRPGAPGGPVPGGMPKPGGMPIPGTPGIPGKPGGIVGRPKGSIESQQRKRATEEESYARTDTWSAKYSWIGIRDGQK
jgi:hypothetical protein